MRIEKSMNKQAPLLVLAPMAGITDWPFRRQAMLHGADKTVTEMISAMGLLQAPRGNIAYQHLLSYDESETNLTAQIFGKDPDFMAEAAAILSALPQYTGLDINFGCPAPKVTSSGSGSALMKDIPRARAIIAAVRKTCAKPLSAKMRIGWDSHSINAVDFAKMCEDEGVDSLCVHGRTRAQQYSGRADWGQIALVKQSVSIPIIANGDVFSAADALVILNQTGADGIALGRGALGKPWLFSQIKQALAGEAVSLPDPQQALVTALDHLEDMVRMKGERRALIEMRKHFAWYLKGTRNAAAARAIINATEELETLKSVLARHFLAEDQGTSAGLYNIAMI